MGTELEASDELPDDVGKPPELPVEGTPLGAPELGPWPEPEEALPDDDPAPALPPLLLLHDAVVSRAQPSAPHATCLAARENLDRNGNGIIAKSLCDGASSVDWKGQNEPRSVSARQLD